MEYSPDTQNVIMIFQLHNKPLNILLFLCSFTLLHAQEDYYFSGYVKNLVSKDVISDAVIKIGEVYVVSNDKGFFFGLLKEGSNRIEITCLGYTPIDTTIIGRDNIFIEFELVPTSYLLEEVVVTNKKQSLIHRGLGNFVIDVSQLRKTPLFLGERDIVKSMQLLPGISSGMEGSSQLNIRGGTNDQTLFLIDNVPVYLQNHAFGLFSIFNSDIIRQAEVYKSGIPAIHGNHLSGGASIRLKNGNMTEHSGSLSISPLAGSISANGPIVKNKLSYLFSVRKSFLDLVFDGISYIKGEVQTGAPLINFYDVNAKITLRVNSQNRLSMIYYTGLDYFYNHSKVQNREEKNEFVYTFKDKLGWKNNLFSLQSESIVGKNILLNNSFYITSLGNMDIQHFKMEDPNTTGNIKNGVLSDLINIGGKSDFEITTNRHLTFKTGIHGAYQLFKPNYILKERDGVTNYFNINKLSLQSYSMYLTTIYLYDKWKISAGLRSSIYKTHNFHFALEPRLKIENNFIDGEMIMLSYDRTTQPTISVNEMNYNSLFDFWIPFKDKLPIANQLSLGYKKLFYEHNLSVSLEAFSKKFKNLVLIKNIDAYLENIESFNLGTGSAKGVELMIDYTPANWSFMAAYSLSKTTRTFNNKTYPFKYDTPHALSLYINYDLLSTVRRRNSLSTNIQIKSGLPYFVPTIKYPNMGLPSDPSGYPYFDSEDLYYVPFEPNTRLNNYFRWDVNFTMEKKTKKGIRTWQFSILNMTAHKNPYSIYLTEDGYKAFQLIPILPSISFTYEK